MKTMPLLDQGFKLDTFIIVILVFINFLSLLINIFLYFFLYYGKCSSLKMHYILICFLFKDVNEGKILKILNYEGKHIKIKSTKVLSLKPRVAKLKLTFLFLFTFLSFMHSYSGRMFYNSIFFIHFFISANLFPYSKMHYLIIHCHY